LFNLLIISCYGAINVLYLLNQYITKQQKDINQRIINN